MKRYLRGWNDIYIKEWVRHDLFKQIERHIFNDNKKKDSKLNFKE